MMLLAEKDDVCLSWTRANFFQTKSNSISIKFNFNPIQFNLDVHNLRPIHKYIWH